MTEPQVWTALGIFAAAFVGVITVTTQLMMRSISTQFDGLQREMVLRFEHIGSCMDALDFRMDKFDSRMDKLDSRIGRLDGRIGRLEQQVKDIDRDVQAISRRVFPE